MVQESTLWAHQTLNDGTETSQEVDVARVSLSQGPGTALGTPNL